MARAANGSGTIRHRTDGRWEGRYVSPKDGKQKSVYGRTQKEVRQKLTRKLAEIDAGTYVDPSKITVSRWLDLWLDEFSGSIKDSTKEGYRLTCNKHLKPALGSLKLSKVTKMQVQLMLNNLKRQNLSDATVRRTKGVLSSAMRAAVDMELLAANPCAKVKVSVPKREKMNIVDRDKMPAFFAAAEKTKHRDMLLLALMTGMRSGELHGLRWEDVDFESGRITISRQLSKIGGVYRLVSPKSGHSRQIRPPKAAMDLLRRHRFEQTRRRLRMGAEWREDDLTRDLVFRRGDGRLCNNAMFRYAVKQVGAEIGIPELSPHDLRHSFAVAAIRAGTDVKTLQNILGHASAAITMNVYVHYTDDMGKTAADKIDSYLQLST